MEDTIFFFIIGQSILLFHILLLLSMIFWREIHDLSFYPLFVDRKLMLFLVTSSDFGWSSKIFPHSLIYGFSSSLNILDL